MVRPDDELQPQLSFVGREESGRTFPAGESPVWVGVGAPGKRPLGLPTVRDRIAQMAAKTVLEPIFEADFLPCSHGFRPHRDATCALEVLRKRAYRDAEGNIVLDADIVGFFDAIDPDRLLGGRVMQPTETSPVSRVGQNRMHGSKGGPTVIRSIGVR